MSILFDHNKLNNMVNAIIEEMRPRGHKQDQFAEYVFMGGTMPNDAQANALAQFSLDKNCPVIFLSFDPDNLAAGPIGLHVIMTDGATQSGGVGNGRLWKRDRHATAIIVFESVGFTVRINAKGGLDLRRIKTPHHSHGYELALETVQSKAKRMKASIPVMFSIGDLPAVMDIQTLSASLAMA